MRLAIIGATGLVGSKILEVLEEYSFPVARLIPVASAKSLGKSITFNHKEWSVLGIDEAIKKKPEIAIFSAGGELSKNYAPQFSAVGTTVIDNSSAWRMSSKLPCALLPFLLNLTVKPKLVLSSVPGQ